MVGGLEVLPFGVLIFVVGSLLVANAWAVVDTRMATSQAAREAGRTYVEAADDVSGSETADRAGREAVSGHGRDADRLVLTFERTSFSRCAPVEVTATYPVPAIRLPFGIGLGHDIDVTSHHTEIVDPYRDGLDTGARCG